MKKTALITGATSGIGLALAQSAHTQAYSVTGLGRDFSRFDSGQKAHYCDHTFSVDMAELSAIDDFCAQQRDALKNLDLLILNAGYGQFGAIEQFSTSQIQRLITTNLTANLVMLSHLVPLMKSSGGGDIVLMGSESALEGAKQGSVYCASKFGMRGLAQSLRAECATSGIRVLLVNPGAVRSEFFDDLQFEPAAGDEFALTPQEVAKAVFNALSLGPNSVVEELNLQPLKRAFTKKS